MGYEIYKEAQDVDYYIVWSSEIDEPVFGGPREELIPYLFDLDDRKPDRIHEFEQSHPENRVKRADQYGTSAMWSNPRHGGWDSEGMTYRGGQAAGGVKRADLFVLTRRLCEDENPDLSDLIEPFDN